MNRKPIFDAVRKLLGRTFRQSEVDLLDRAIDAALGKGKGGVPCERLGALSERFESGGRGPGTVSSGAGDPGGVSYGIYQLASRTGTVAVFLRAEGKPWADDFAGTRPGDAAFSAAWKAVARRDADAFAAAQHAFIRRTHYQPAVDSVLRETGLDLDGRHPAVRDATWSVAVQHGRAAQVLADAVRRADATCARGDAAYDAALVEAIYDVRTDYVLGIAARSNAMARRTLEAMTRTRYPEERSAALAMFENGAANG